MILPFQRNKEVKRLPKPVREYMWQKFMLSEVYINELRCFEYEEDSDEREIMQILIFHPLLARSQHILLRSYRDLEQHREVLLYGGYVDARGSVYIENRQKMSYTDRTSGQML